MSTLPTGRVTFLFTDIEGSTDLLHALGDHRYSEVLADHYRLLRGAFAAYDGREVDTQGDAFFVAFARAIDAIAAAVAAQEAVARHPWPENCPVRVRMGIHTGEPIVASGNYVGLDVHRAARICAAGHGGQVLISQATQAVADGGFPAGVAVRDMGAHRLKDLAQPVQLFQLVIPDLPTDFPPLRSLSAFPNNLPKLLTSFVGREHELVEIRERLSAASLVTLVGTGGSGKTRLAIQVGAELLESFRDGVWLVELASLSDASLLPQTLGTTLHIRESPGRGLTDTLIDYLRAKKALVVLDNCEHLIVAAADLVAMLLRACPHLRILATSRSPLAVGGEVLYRVPPLSRPDPRRRLSGDQLKQFESAQLFIERAVIAQPRFTLTESNAQAIVRVVHQLDGIPLAIELAAARVRVLSVEQIADRLGDMLRLLTDGSRTGVRHHRTLRAAMDWSFDLLTDAERVLFRWLSVFLGGFSIGAAEQVCSDERMEVFEVLDLLTALVDHSLIMVEGTNGESRYRMLETVRAYAQQKLQDSGDAPALRRRHQEWCLGLAEEAEPALRGPDQLMWLDRLEMDHDDLRAALEWSGSAENEAATGLRLAGALHRFWARRGYLSEGREWLGGALARQEGAAVVTRAKATYAAGSLAFDQGDFERADALCRESLSLYRQVGNRFGTALSLNVLANVARSRGDYSQATALVEESLTHASGPSERWAAAQALNISGLTARRQGDYSRAQSFFEESLALWRELGDRWGLAASLGHLGVIARLQGDYDGARALHEESLAIRRELADRLDLASSIISLGTVALNQGDHARAAQLFEESLMLSSDLGDRLSLAASLGNLAVATHYLGEAERAKTLVEKAKVLWAELGDRPALAASLNVLGMVAYAQRDYERALESYKESLLMYRELRDHFGLAESLMGLAKVLIAQGDPFKAARLFGAAEVLREAVGRPLPHAERGEYERAMAELHHELDAATFADAWARGRSVPDDIVEEAMTG